MSKAVGVQDKDSIENPGAFIAGVCVCLGSGEGRMSCVLKWKYVNGCND